MHFLLRKQQLLKFFFIEQRSCPAEQNGMQVGGRKGELAERKIGRKYAFRLYIATKQSIKRNSVELSHSVFALVTQTMNLY